MKKVLFLATVREGRTESQTPTMLLNAENYLGKN